MYGNEELKIHINIYTNNCIFKKRYGQCCNIRTGHLQDPFDLSEVHFESATLTHQCQQNGSSTLKLTSQSSVADPGSDAFLTPGSSIIL